MLGGRIGGVQEEQVDAPRAQRRVLPHARVPAHVARVQNVLRAHQGMHINRSEHSRLLQPHGVHGAHAL